ncbi:MAG: preprotein translocase subunit YajC [Gammaproteobacteria bacterium]|nr:MAG: preprotein translocase subunit YajC [Gammaproteobacteria bacterium]
MDFFITNAIAEGAGILGNDSSAMSLLFPIILLAVFYFVFIRPQQKKAKEHKSLLGSLKKSDEIVTAGGLVGKIKTVDENFVDIEIASSIVVKIQKQAIANVLPKGSLKTSTSTTRKAKKPIKKNN